MLCWGLLVGLGTGSMALAFVATVTSRWFVDPPRPGHRHPHGRRRPGQLIFLPLLAVARRAARLARRRSRPRPPRSPSCRSCCWLLRDHPARRRASPRTAPGRHAGRAAAAVPRRRPARGRCAALLDAARTGPFWLLAGTFAICGASTNGLIGTHFVPAAHDHGMPITTAASLLAGRRRSSTSSARSPPAGSPTASTRGGCWPSTTRCAASRCFLLPLLLRRRPCTRMLFFIVFYGLDWVATVPPTIALCREHYGDARRSSSAGCSPPTRSARPWPPSAPGRPRPARLLRLGLVRAGALCLVAAVMCVASGPLVPLMPHLGTRTLVWWRPRRQMRA